MNPLAFNALYGSFDINMAPIKVSDVTTVVASNFLVNKQITIPPQIQFIDYFGNPAPDQRRFLQIRHNDRIYNIADDEYENGIEIVFGNKKKNITIVYFIYLNRNANWKEIVSGQLQQLKSYGILDEANLYIHITDPDNVFVDVIAVVTHIANDAIIKGSRNNFFEYHAIKTIYELAQEDPDSIYIYLHTKGISYDIPSRTDLEILLLAKTFENWRKNLEIFNDKSINKIGLFAALEGNEVQLKAGAVGGWIWYNFWFARGIYIANYCDMPTIREDRWYFEKWLGGPQDAGSVSKGDCYSLYKESDKMYFTAEETFPRIEYLKNQYKFNVP